MIQDQLKTAYPKPETPSEACLLISGTTHTLHRLFPINAAVPSLKVFGGLCILQELELASITSSQLWYLSVFKERVHLAVRGKFLSKTLVSLGKTDEVMGNLTAIVSVLSGFKEKVMSNILYVAMRWKSTDFDSSYRLSVKSHEWTPVSKHFPITVRERDVCFQ